MKILRYAVPQVSGRVSQNDGTILVTYTVLIETDSVIPVRSDIEKDDRWFPKLFSILDGLFFVDWTFGNHEGSIHKVELIYSNKLPESDIRSGSFNWIQNPLNRPVGIRRSTWRKSMRLFYDKGGQGENPKRIATAAGEDLFLTKDLGFEVFHVAKNLPQPYSMPVSAIPNTGKRPFAKFTGPLPGANIGSLDFTNIDTVILKGQVCKPFTLWATDFDESELQFENRIPYYAFAFAIRHSASGWRDIRLNAGYRRNVEIVTFKIDTAQGTTYVDVEDWNGKEETIPRVGAQLGYISKRRIESREIVIGDPPAYPSEPVPLDEKGFVFKNKDGEIITSERGGLEPHRLNYLEFQNLNPINFANAFPWLQQQITIPGQ
jgi:hypothetical protein